jgi:hypothetical protein
VRISAMASNIYSILLLSAIALTVTASTNRQKKTPSLGSSNFTCTTTPSQQFLHFSLSKHFHQLLVILEQSGARCAPYRECFSSWSKLTEIKRPYCFSKQIQLNIWKTQVNIYMVIWANSLRNHSTSI